MGGKAKVEAVVSGIAAQGDVEEWSSDRTAENNFPWEKEHIYTSALNLKAHHAKELLRQRIMGEEVELCGVWGQSRVGGRGIVEPRPQRQMLSKQLHIVLYPL